MDNTQLKYWEWEALLLNMENLIIEISNWIKPLEPIEEIKRYFCIKEPKCSMGKLKREYTDKV